MADAQESRQLYFQSNELEPAHWDALMTYLGSMGTVSEVQQDLALGHEEYEGLLVNSMDFHDFAKRHNLPSNLATKAWSALKASYNLKVNARYFTRNHSEWYDPNRYKDVPLVFGVTPEPAINPNGFEDYLADLHLDSLEAMLAIIDEDVEKQGRRASARMFSQAHTAGPKTLDFYRKFVAEKRQEDESTKTAQE